MQEQPHTVAQRLLNLYRQAHVINGGWAAVNKVLIAESDDEQVVEALEKLPTGKRLMDHIKSLREGKTPMDTIDDDFLPYGGLLARQDNKISLDKSEMDELKNALDNLKITPEGLKKIKQLPFVRKFGNNWAEDIKSAISGDDSLLAKWDNVVRAEKAYQMWDSAKQLISETLTERNRAQIQADMPEFETYLPMFGEAGNEVLKKLRTFISSLAQTPKSAAEEAEAQD
jgi:hypothetical protein